MSLTPDQIEALAVRAAERAAERAARLILDEAADRAAERASLSPDQISDLVANAVRQTLLQMGVDASNPLEMQKDFQHLREWRTAGSEIKTKGLLALLGVFLTGVGTLIVMGIKESLSK